MSVTLLELIVVLIIVFTIVGVLANEQKASPEFQKALEGVVE